MVSRVPVSLVASEKLLFLFFIKPNSFLTFSLPSPSLDLKGGGGGNSHMKQTGMLVGNLRPSGRCSSFL